MAYAAEKEMIVLTHDLDFGAIPATTHREKPGVVQIRSEDVSPDSIGLQVVSAVQQMEAELEGWPSLSIEPARGRIRALPSRVVGHELEAPLSDRFIEHGDASFSERALDVARAHTETVVEPDRVADDFERESVSVVAWLSGGYVLSVEGTRQLDNALWKTTNSP